MENKLSPQTAYSDTGRPSSFNRDTPPAPFAHKGLKKSLESIVSSPDPKPKRGSLETMFSDKAKNLKASVNALLEEIKLRGDLNSRLFRKMNREICKQHTELMQLEKIQDS